jgi:hypothetical protein
MTEQPVDPAVDDIDPDDPDAPFVEEPDPTDDQYLPPPAYAEDDVQDDGAEG